MSWSFSMKPVKPEELPSKLDAAEKPSHCPDADWREFKAVANLLSGVRFTNEPYVTVSGHGHDPTVGTYPHRSICVSVNGSDV